MSPAEAQANVGKRAWCPRCASLDKPVRTERRVRPGVRQVQERCPECDALVRRWEEPEAKP